MPGQLRHRLQSASALWAHVPVPSSLITFEQCSFDVVCAQLRLPTYEGGCARKRAASMIFDLAMTGETDESLVAKVLAEFPLEEGHRT
jgi:hypothetical protein